MEGNKVILFRNYKASRPLVKLIESHLERWVRGEVGVSHLIPRYSYKVEIEREPDSHYFSCRLKIKIAQSEWRSLQSGHSPQDAFFHCLRRIRMTHDFPLFQNSA